MTPTMAFFLNRDFPVIHKVSNVVNFVLLRSEG